MHGTSSQFDTLIDFDLQVGESPVWDEDRNLLWFVDVLKPAVYAMDPASHNTIEYPMPAAVGSVGLMRDGRLIVALRSGIHYFDPLTRELAFVVHPEPDRTMNRLNDGKVGPDGCFWVGSMHDSTPREPSGALYRVAPDGTSTKVMDGLRVSNGLAWSPDGRTMYHSDSRGPVVCAFDFDIASGMISNKRTIITIDEKGGLPDGAAVDCDGYYWSAGVTAGVLNRIAPDGTLVDIIKLPVAAPTMPCFGGTDLKTMYITSMAHGTDSAWNGGRLIKCRSNVAGVPVGKFDARA